VSVAVARASRSAVPTSSLLDALERNLGRPVVALKRSPSRYATSATIEDITARLDDGLSLSLVFKDLDPAALLDNAKHVKPSFLRDPLREIYVYRDLLGSAALGTARCYAAAESHAGAGWLLLEKVPGVELYQVGELERWQVVAHWLAGMHRRLTPAAERIRARGWPPLVLHDAAYYRRWLDRAVTFAFDRDASVRRRLQWLADRHDAVVERLISLPVTIVHSDFSASNVFVAETATGLRVCPVDWESAALGPGLTDLAALVAGWNEPEVVELAAAYASGMGGGSEPLSTVVAVLDACRFQQCIQWLGWSHRWIPPAEHAQDWLAEAVALAERGGW
jgi:hypothetical protein